MELSPVVDLAFPLQGTSIPADHGYALYAAVSRHLSWLHGDEAVGIHPVQGQLIGNRLLALTPTSALVLRLPLDRLPDAVRLAGQRLEVDGHRALVGVPSTRALRPTSALASRLVVIRGFTEADAFLDAVRRQLTGLDIACAPSLIVPRSTRSLEGGKGSQDKAVRRTLRIHGKEVVGFAVQVSKLTLQDSVRLQAVGLGGRRRFGCGIFVAFPATELAV